MHLEIAPLASTLRRCVALAAVCVALIVPASAQADLIISVQHVTAAAGAIGAGLDVTLENTGPSAVDIGGFAFELTGGDPAITFTDVTTSTTDPYIFGALGLFGPSIGISATGQDILASDIYSVSGSGTTLAAGTTMGLGHLVFDVSSTANGIYSILLTPFPGTSLNDFNGGNVEFTRLANGFITVRNVPEPGSLALVGIGVAITGLIAARRRRQANV